MARPKKEKSAGPFLDEGLESSAVQQYSVKVLAASDPGFVLSQCAVLERRVFPKHESLARTLEREVKRRNALLIYACTEGVQVVLGYVIVSWRAPASGSIEKVCVAEMHRRQGIGRALCKAGVEVLRVKSVKEVGLYVDPFRDGAVALYEALGFVKQGVVIKGFYCEGRDAVKMLLQLGD